MTTILNFTLTLSLLGAAASLVAGCGSDITTSGTTSSGAGGDDTSSSSSNGVGGASGGCTVDTICPQNGTCIFPQGACSPSDKGVCQLAYDCSGPPSGPVCGCNGKVVEDEVAVCSFWAGGKPFAFAGGCQTGTFACGPTLQCARNADVCKKTLPGVPGPAGYECVALEKVTGSSCQYGIPDCLCLNLDAIGPAASCTADADYQETVTLALP
jgi:hypothetical protein